MTRFLLATSLIGASVSAAAGAATYSAKPIAPVAQARIITSNIAWNCGPDACSGSTEESRPLVLCQGLAKKAGLLESFVVNGRALGAVELDKCNMSAKGGATQALARAN